MNDFSEQPIDHLQRIKMLTLARDAIRDHLTLGYIKAYKHDDLTLTQMGGVFVTLWASSVKTAGSSADQNERLRGCVGRIQGDGPLFLGIQESAVSAATKDPRFAPVTITELELIRIEIAILSVFHEVGDLREVVVGDHGLLIEGLNKRGLLLPKVAKRLNWNRNSFYRAICEKAGLSYDCWPGDAVLYRFATITVEE